MKTKFQFLKENIVLLFLIWIPCNRLIVDIVYKIGSTIIFWLLCNFYTVDSWYNDYRFEELEKQIKDKNNENKIM